MKRLLDEATDPWGVRVERVVVKDVRLPVQLQRAVAAEAEAAREARAPPGQCRMIQGTQNQCQNEYFLATHLGDQAAEQGL